MKEHSKGKAATKRKPKKTSAVTKAKASSNQVVNNKPAGQDKQQEQPSVVTPNTNRKSGAGSNANTPEGNPLNLFSSFVKASSQANAKAAGRECVIYTRVSTRDQAEKFSLEVQMKACMQHAKQLSLPVAATFGGTHESAKTDDRKEFQRMLDYVQRNRARVGTILVYSIDRFSRSEESIGIATRLKKQGVKLLSVMQPMDTDTASGAFQQKMYLLFSELENQQRKDKCIAGMREKLRQGYWIGRAPVGYDHYTQNGEQHIVINKQGKLIKQAFEWKLAGLTNEEIRVRLAVQDLRLNKQRLSDLFRNPFYCGLVINQVIDGEIVRGKHKGIVSEELFLKVNGVLSSNHQHYQHEKENDELPLKRFVRCAKCGTSYAGYLVKKKGLYYYKCNQKGCCCNNSARRMHESFEELLSVYQIDERLIPALSLQLELTFKALNEENIQHAKGLKEGLAKLDEKLEQLQERFAFGHITQELYEKFSAKLLAERQPLEAELEKVDGSLSNLSQYIEKSLLIASKLGEYWKEGDYNTKEKLQYLVFPEGVQYEHKNKAYRTDRVNVIFSLISSLSEEKYKNKKGQTNMKIDLSGSVAGAGLEPATFGL